MGWILEVDMRGRPRNGFSQKLVELEAALDRGDFDNVVVHVHGGLVDHKTGMEVSQKFIDFFEPSPKKKNLVVAFVWPTGMEDIFGGLKNIFGSKSGLASPNTAAISTPDELAKHIQTLLSPEMRELWKRKSNGRRRRRGLEPFLSPEEKKVIHEVLKAMVSFWKLIGWAQSTPTNLQDSALEKTFQAVPPLLWLVRYAWGEMNRAADACVARGGGAERLWNLLAHHPRLQDGGIKTTVFAASAGARLVSRLLVAQHDPWNKFQPHLVFAAPAISVAKWDSALRVVKSQLKSSTLVVMGDTLESSDPLFWGWDPQQDRPILRNAYPASLLYLISRCLDSIDDAPMPLVGLREHHTAPDPDFAQWLAKLETADRARYSGEPIPGLNPSGAIWHGACFHGDFDDDKITHCSDPTHIHPAIGKPSPEWTWIKSLL